MTDLALYDLCFYLSDDNPYRSERKGELKSRFKIKRDEIQPLFIDILENVRSHHIYSNNGSIQLNDSSRLSDLGEVENIVKGFFFENIDKFDQDDKLLEWSKPIISNPIPIVTQPVIENTESNDESIEIEDITPIPSITAIKPVANVGKTIYDHLSYHTLSWEEVCEICFNLAKKQHLNINAKSASIEKIESERKTQLIETIHKYLQIGALERLKQKDLASMDLESLEELRRRCEMTFETLKTKEVLSSTINIASTVMTNIFPDGIPLGKQRRMRTKNIKDLILNSLCNSTSVTGSAFNMYLEKHSVRISNGLLIAAKLGEIFLSNVEIVQKSDEPVIEELPPTGTYADISLTED